MHPVLFQIGPVTLYTYGLFVAAGFVAALSVSRMLAKKNNLSPDLITDTYFIVLVSAIIGARLLYVVIEFDTFRGSFLEIFKIWNGGLVFYGGFITACTAVVIYLKYRKADILLTGDVIAPGIALGHAFGRVGCLFAGCCHGSQCDLPWAIKFSDPQSLAPLDVYVHPTQLYSVLSNLAIFLVLLLAGRKTRKHGTVLAVYIILYSVMRSFIEFFRGDLRGSLFNGCLSTSQFIGIIAALAGMVLLVYIKRNKNNAG
jgi:phosphatidylglycerol:prolipoprotein diacylglycerol transferase